MELRVVWFREVCAASGKKTLEKVGGEVWVNVYTPLSPVETSVNKLPWASS